MDPKVVAMVEQQRRVAAARLSIMDALSKSDVPVEDLMKGPQVQWNHVDGPLMTWAGRMHWLTWGERLRITLRLTSVEKLASERWPYTAMRFEERRLGLE